MCVQVPVETRSGRRIPRGRSCCEPPDLGARKPIPILWKSSKCPQSVSLLSSFRRAILEVIILDTGQMLIMSCKCITVQVLASLARARVCNQRVQISLQHNGQKQITEMTLSFKFCCLKMERPTSLCNKETVRKTSLGHRAVLDKGALNRSFCLTCKGSWVSHLPLHTTSKFKFSNSLSHSERSVKCPNHLFYYH